MRTGRSRPIRSGGFTLIELIAVITIVVVMMALFLDRMVYYQERAEKTAMEGVAASIQSALILQFGSMLTQGRSAEVSALVHGNPVNWLQKPPRNYAGEYYDPTPLSVRSGSWMFDLRTRQLIYVPNSTYYFQPGRDGLKWVRFHVVVGYEAARPSPTAEPSGLLFEPVEPYSWF